MNEMLTTRREIQAWLDSHRIMNYSIRSDCSVDVLGSVFLRNMKLSHIPVKFHHVSGNFDCSFNRLTSIDFSPNTIDGNFFIENNALRSLHGAMRRVAGNFLCNSNQLASLEFCPDYVGNKFYANRNDIGSLEFFPSYVGNSICLLDNPRLEQIQELFTFKECLQEHERILILREQKKLMNAVEEPLSFERPSFKI